VVCPRLWFRKGRAVEGIVSWRLQEQSKSTFVLTDNRSRILAETEINAAPFATLIADVPAVHDNTLYLLLGDWFAWVVLAILLFTLLQLIRLRVC
jgi:apolipoprotein N-acyltransferase